MPGLEIEILDEPVEPVTLTLPLDRKTIRWLLKLSRGCDREAARKIASMVRMIREDDEAAHSTHH